MLAALMFRDAMRFGEAAALTWRDYTADIGPLGRLVVDKSYSTNQPGMATTWSSRICPQVVWPGQWLVTVM